MPHGLKPVGTVNPSQVARRGKIDPEGGGEADTRLGAATPHSFRASMVGWAARSRSSNAFNEARLTGRWQWASRVFETYWRFGMSISAEMVRATRGEDKIVTFKPWPFGMYTHAHTHTHTT